MIATDYTPQRRQALQKAREVKQAKAEFRRKLRELGHDQGALLVAKYLDDNAAVLRGFIVRDLLKSIPHVGGSAAMRLMIEADCPSGAQAGGEYHRDRQTLSERRRMLLAKALRDRVDRVRLRRERDAAGRHE